MAGEAAPGGPAPTSTPRVTLLFRVPYMTQWGQNLVVVGAGERLGEWKARAGPWMGCSFEGETLVWTVILSVPWTPAIEYKYAVVDEQVEVVRQESLLDSFIYYFGAWSVFQVSWLEMLQEVKKCSD